MVEGVILYGLLGHYRFLGNTWIPDSHSNLGRIYFLAHQQNRWSCEATAEEVARRAMNDNIRSKLDCVGMFLLARHNTSRVTYGDAIQILKRGECEK